MLLEHIPLGDLGHPRVDARLLMAIVLRGGKVAQWLCEHGIDSAIVACAFPNSGWPLQPPLAWPLATVDPSDQQSCVAVQLDELHLGDLGDSSTDARLLNAILLRDRRVSEWLRSKGVDATYLETVFPGSAWA